MPVALLLTASVLLSVYPVPLAVQTRVKEVALLVAQATVYVWPATSVAGVRVIVSVGAGVAAVVVTVSV